MTDLARVALTLQRSSALPEDRVVMSWWFYLPPGWDAPDLTGLLTAVRDWMIVTPAGASLGIEDYLATTVALNNHTVSVYTYDMATGERLTFELDAPQGTITFNLGGTGAGAQPAEVACCVSHRNNTGAVPGGGNFGAPPARRRGRVFVGPLGTSASGTVLAGDARPLAAFTDTLRKATLALKTAAEANTTPMVIYSRPFAGRGEIERPGRPTLPAIPARTGQAYLTESIWTDDAWDTQRRRGSVRTLRTFI